MDAICGAATRPRCVCISREGWGSSMLSIGVSACVCLLVGWQRRPMRPCWAWPLRRVPPSSRWWCWRCWWWATCAGPATARAHGVEEGSRDGCPRESNTSWRRRAICRWAVQVRGLLFVVVGSVLMRLVAAESMGTALNTDGLTSADVALDIEMSGAWGDRLPAGRLRLTMVLVRRGATAAPHSTRVVHHRHRSGSPQGRRL